MYRLPFIGLLLGCIAATSLVDADDPTDRRRSGEGLLALYDFRETDGPLVKDRSGVGEPLDLRIADLKAVQRKNGTLVVQRETVIRSDKPAAKIIDAVRRSQAITIEAWIVPAKTNQSGPARIVSLSPTSRRAKSCFARWAIAG